LTINQLIQNISVFYSKLFIIDLLKEKFIYFEFPPIDGVTWQDGDER